MDQSFSISNIYHILISAREKIDIPEKWGKKRRYYDRPDTTCCAAEAIEDTVEFSPMRLACYKIIEQCAGLSGKWEDSEMLPCWNDAPATTYEDVIHTYNLAIATVKDFR